MIDRLENIDQELFLWMNSLHAEWLDQPMYYMSEKLFWIPVYLFLIYLLVKSYDVKTALWSLLGVIVVVTLCDRISVELFKEVFQRYRPTHNLEIGNLVHTVNDYRGGMYGFVSSHAANFFGISTFLHLILRKAYGIKALWIFLWAGLIAYTRVYLGVHYPGDILCGGILGCFVGWVVYFFFNKLILKKI